MAKMSLSQRFPVSFRVIMTLAIVLAIPLTVWSTQNASTQTEQHASVPPEPYCSSFNIRDCIYGCQPTTNGGYCKSAPTPTPAPLASPTNLNSSTSNCVKSDATFTANFSLTWNKIVNATSYKVKVYSPVPMASPPYAIGEKNYAPTTNNLSSSGSFPGGYRVYFSVRGYNKNSNVTGPVTIKEIVFSCNKPLIN